MRYIFFIFLCWASSGFAGERKTSHTNDFKELQLSLAKVQESDQPFTHNPLEKYNFEHFLSRSYLYFYRASAYAHSKKTGKEKLQNLDLALDDLKQAKVAPYGDDKRIDQLFTDVLKEKIDLLRGIKNYQAVIDTIGKLREKDRVDTRFIVYYAEALFLNGNIDDFKKLARNYFATLNDETVLKKYLGQTPRWNSAMPNISSVVVDKSVKILPNPPLFTKEILLKDPIKSLEQLDKNFYFKSAENIFKIASETYLASYKKSALLPAESKFVKSFQKKMHSFAPAYIDSLIFSFWKLSDLKTAEILSRSFLDQFLGHSLVPKILYNLGRIQEDGKSYEQASLTFKKFLDTSDDATYLELAKFRAAWTLYLAKREEDAKPYFEDYVRSYPDGRYASTCEYFLIKSRALKPQLLENAVKNFIKKYPLNLFSFLLIDEYKLSHALVLQNLSTQNALKNNFSTLDFKADIKTLNQLATYRELKELGLRSDAIKMLKNISFDTNNELLNLYLASQFEELNDIHGQVSNLIKVASNSVDHRALVPWKNLFPSYRRETIEKELLLQKSNASPWLVLALIRQESTFNNLAQSTANAMGLMQLTSTTAKEAAKRLDLKEYSLFNEEDNLRLGIKTFVDLLKKYGRIDYALAAYNAGENATNLWVTLRGHLEPLAFIESIPYPETRIYVKSILRNFAIYRMLYETNSRQLVSYNFEN